MITHSVLTCPHCGHQREEVMPLDACQWFYECVNCAEMLHPNPGDLLRLLLFRQRTLPPHAAKPNLLRQLRQ